ncbi:MAG TPA: hypothetical protein VIV60_34750, partial [Polyangiaceae bacterium]
MILGSTLTAVRPGTSGRPPRPLAKAYGAARAFGLGLSLFGCCKSLGQPRDQAVEAAHQLAAKDRAALLATLVDDNGGSLNSNIDAALLSAANPRMAQLVYASRRRDFEMVTARYRLNNGQAVVLESNGDEFRLRWAPFPLDCPGSVSDALRGLRYAVEQQTSANTASVLSSRLQIDLAMEQRALLKGLQFIEELDVTATSSRAQVTLPTGYVVVILEERNCW